MGLLSKLFSKKDKIDWNNYDGYIERKFLSFDIKNEYQINIFKDSSIPIVKSFDMITRRLDITNTQNPDKTIHQHIKETWYFELSKEHAFEFVSLIENVLNSAIKKNRIPAKYIIPINKISFSKELPKALPDSFISYSPDEHFFCFYFSGSSDMNGSLYIDEDGNYKKAIFTMFTMEDQIKETFKSYKNGFDIYKITEGKEIKYQRNK